MKKLSFLMSLLLLFNLCTFSAAALSPEVYQETQVIYTEEYGDVLVETTLIIQPSLFRSSEKTASRTNNYSSGGTRIATVTLTATFGYDGRSAWVEDADGSHTVSGGWSYKNEEITTSGNTAELTAKLTKLLSSNIPVELSLSCSPTGTIS